MIFVGYSLGGLICRELINRGSQDVRGVLFIASPLTGDNRMDLIVRKDIAGYLPGTQPFLDSLESINTDEFITHFFERGFEPSAISKGIFDISDSNMHQKYN